MAKTLTFSKSCINFSTISYQKKDRFQNYRVLDIKRKHFFIGILIFSIVIFFVFQINFTVERNYQIREFENQISGLLEENQKLKVGALSLENSQFLFERAKYLGLEENAQLRYVKIINPRLSTVENHRLPLSDF